MKTSRACYILIALGLSIALFAMVLDEWTKLRGLELASGCIGLITSILAAIIAVCDLTASRERRNGGSGAIADSAGSTSEARGHRLLLQGPALNPGSQS